MSIQVSVKYWLGLTDIMWKRCFFSLGWRPNSDFIVGSVENSLGKWTLVVAVISVDAYPFLTFSDLTCHLEGVGIDVFWLHGAAWQ